MKKNLLISGIFVAASIILSLYFYPLLPEKVVTHWSITGQPNGYSSKLFASILFPAILAVMSLLFLLIPQIDPLKKNIQTFWNYFLLFISVLFFFMLYLQILFIQWNRGFTFDFIRFLLPAFTILLYSIGLLIEKSKRNWFIGIRTPWTLSSDEIWQKTHKLGAPLFKISAILLLAGVIWPLISFYVLIGLIIIDVLIPVIYSYMLYQKQK